MKLNEWQIHPDNCTLVPDHADDASQQPVRIPPRCMDVLLYLAARPGQVISTEELLTAFWASPATTDHAVHKVIASLRSALGDEPHDPRFIKTLPRRGYALIAEISEEASEISKDQSRSRSRLRAVSGSRLRVAGTLSAAILMTAVLALWLPGATEQTDATMAAGTPDTRDRRITLLQPSLSLASPLLQQNQVNAVLDSLAVSLGRIPGLDVVIAAPGSHDGRHARDGYALHTSIYDTGEKLRLTVRLRENTNGTNLYADHFSLAENNLPAIEQEVIPTVVESLAIHLDESRLRDMHSEGTQIAQAYLHYLKAEFFANQFNHADWYRAMEHYEAAIQADPEFVNAYLGKATAANNMSIYSRNARGETLGREVMDLARRLALVAPDSDAVDTLNVLRMSMEGRNEWQQEREYREQILAGDAPGYVYARYALYLIGARLYREAEGFLALAGTSERPGSTPNVAWNFRTQILPPSELAEVKVNQLVERPMHIGILGTAISSLAFTGDLQKARYLLKRQKQHDRDGVRAHLSEILVGAMAGRLHDRELCPEVFAIERLNDPDLAFNNGVLFFMLGDLESGADYWRHLTRIDRRKLFTRLHAIEPFFPDNILEDPRYADLLDELQVGRNWQHRLMAGIQELSEQTGIQLSQESRAHLEDGVLMLQNNLWDESTAESVKQQRNGLL